MRRPRLSIAHLALLALTVLTLAGCGAAGNQLNADDEGIYVEIGHLKYQVQLSRQLNPSNAEDAGYLVGLSPDQRKLGPGQAFFAVFLRVENPTGVTRDPALSFTISDTQDNAYQPLVPDQSNVFAYRALPLTPHGQLPVPDSPALAGPTQGALVLFKVRITSYDNRPLTLKIADPASSETGRIALDV